MTRATWIGLVLVPAALLSACGGSSTTSGTPTGSTASASSTPAASTTASAAPTATPASSACTGSELNVVFGGESSASGGQQGLTALLANNSGTACKLSGTIGAQLLTSSGGLLTTSWSDPSAPGSAWLVPDRVALDAWWPQSGEATVTISWHTGDVQPGQCSGAAPSVGEISLSVPGGGSVTGTLTSALAQISMAPCKGVIVLGPVTQASPPQAFPTPTAAAQMADQEEFAGAGPSNPSYSVATGSAAAVVSYGGPDCGADTYVWQDSAGWHVLDTACAQASGYSPVGGTYDFVYGPTSSGCASVHSSPSHTSIVTGCITFSSTSGSQFPQNTKYTVDEGPTYTAETDATSQQPAGTIWWHLQGEGWLTQDYLVNLVP